MEPIGTAASGLAESVSVALALKGADLRARIDVSLLKNALDFQKLLGAEIARMLGAGANLDIRA
mgnify:CR=1 FL=1